MTPWGDVISGKGDRRAALAWVIDYYAGYSPWLVEFAEELQDKYFGLGMLWQLADVARFKAILATYHRTSVVHQVGRALLRMLEGTE